MSITKSDPKLDGLPDELLLRILDHLTNQRDIYHMCLVNHQINAVADPVLYKSISFAQPRHHVAFSASLIARPRRGSLIENVRLEYPSEELSDILHLMDTPSKIDNFSHALAAMSNLESLVLSVPEKLCRGIGVLLNDPFALACLKSCTLFYQCEDNAYWDLQDNIHIFSHPSLESLTIRRAKLDQRGFESLELPSETPLRELHLIECDLNDDGLTELLLFPEALKEVTITQREEPSPPLEQSPDDIDDFIFALRSAIHSLETISIDFPTLHATEPLKLRDFEGVTSLELRDYQLFGESGLSSVAFPPNLETLTFLNEVDTDKDRLELLCYTLEKKDIFARSLRQLVVPEGKSALPERLVAVCTPPLVLCTVGSGDDDDDDDEDDETYDADEDSVTIDDGEADEEDNGNETSEDEKDNKRQHIHTKIGYDAERKLDKEENLEYNNKPRDSHNDKHLLLEHEIEAMKITID